MELKTTGIIKILKNHSKETGTKPFTTQIQYKDLDQKAYYEKEMLAAIVKHKDS